MKQQRQNKNRNENPCWQDLNPFILSKIFSFLSLHDQLFVPPYVCHSWLSATFHTLFSNSILDLRPIDTLDQENQRLRFTHLLKLAINHYHGWVTIIFPDKTLFGHFGTLYIAERTPNISRVTLSTTQECVNMLPIFLSVLYWKKLRNFRARMRPEVGFLVISQLADHCKNITWLGLRGTYMEKEVTCIVEGFSLLEVLDLSESTLCANALEIVLDGRLKRLKEINILHCKILGDDGKDIRDDYLKLKEFCSKVRDRASRVKSLKNLKNCLGKNCLNCKDGNSTTDDK